MNLKHIAVALIAMVPVVANASSYCSDRAAFAKQVVIGREAGVEESTLQEALTVFIETEPASTGLIDRSIIREAFTGRLSSMTPNGYAYKVEKACSAARWESK